MSKIDKTSARRAIYVVPVVMFALGGLEAAPAAAQDAQAIAKLQARVDALQRRVARLEGQLGDPASPDGQPRQRASSDPAAQQALRLPEGTPPITAQGGPLSDPPSDGFRIGTTQFRISGAIKTDLMFSRYGNGKNATVPLGRDLAFPNSIPVGGRASGLLVDGSAKQSRIGFQTSTPVGRDFLTTLIEADFQAAPGAGNERSLNAYNFGLRRAVAGYGGLAFGQDWTNFQYVAALPETVDFLGVTEGTVFARQMVLRYAHLIGGGVTVSVSIENPETVTTSPTSVTLVDHDDDSVPDLTAQMLWKGNGASLSITGLLRTMRVDPADGRNAANIAGYGLSMAGVLPVSLGKGDDIRAMLTAGRAIGRYVGVNLAADAIYDPARNALDPVGLIAGYIAYRHFWCPRVRSTVMGSFQSIDNPATAVPLSNRLAWSTAANLYVTPLPRLDIGVEFRFTERVLENGMSGSLNRLQFTMKQGF